MVEMKSGKVLLSLAAELASWRAVLVLLRTWATCKPWQRKNFHQYSILLADCLNQSKQTVRESAGCAAATESRKVGKGRRKRRYADVEGPGAKSEPELGPHGPKLKKQVLKGFDGLDLRLGLQPADSVDITQHFEWERETRARDKDSSSEEYPWGNSSLGARLFPSDPPKLHYKCSLGPRGSPSSIRKVADRKVADASRSSSSSPSAAPVPGWRSFFCLGNGK